MEFFNNNEFQFEALAQLTSQKFVDEVKDKINLYRITKFDFKDNEDHMFLHFYAQDSVKKHSLVLICYYSTKYGEYFSIDKMYSTDLKSLGLKIVEA
jgi:hypothetical protein